MAAPDHADAWDVAHQRRMNGESSNLEDAYLDLRDAAQKCVDAYYVASGKVVIDGQDGYDPLRRLRIICETNQD